MPGLDLEYSETAWNTGEPNDYGNNENCAMNRRSEGWNDVPCTNEYMFICYNDEVILIQESKTWEEALNYCTENYRDLVSITNRHQQRWVQERAKNASTPFVWLGLRYTCTLDFWFWVSDKLVCYDNWDSPATTDDCVSAAAMDRGGQHKWFKKADTEKFNFICAL
ncbi:lithostathine-1-beta-like [Morone saxatilis]|uniref:lithostathine-1-beta-like n=1 Tax=Morone saxatilis TaxID=34816 RepID=UPI0015E1CED3|nr:lithostathine-1-beta-like [Morone saxatilis]